MGKSNPKIIAKRTDGEQEIRWTLAPKDYAELKEKGLAITIQGILLHLKEDGTGFVSYFPSRTQYPVTWKDA